MAEAIISRADATAQGLKSYFTGKPCKQGHVAERQTSGRGCLECMRLHSLDWKGRNRDRSNEATNAWKEANPAAGTEWHRQNRDRSRAACRRYYQRNRPAMIERGKVAEANRRAVKKGAGGKHTVADRRAILAAQGHRCTYCRADLRKVKRHLDHIMPLALGGSNSPDNLQYLCAPCNLSKGAKHPTDFANERGLLL